MIKLKISKTLTPNKLFSELTANLFCFVITPTKANNNLLSCNMPGTYTIAEVAILDNLQKIIKNEKQLKSIYHVGN